MSHDGFDESSGLERTEVTSYLGQSDRKRSIVADTSGSGTMPRQRKRRKPINCAACRHLKIKCDRTVPCGQCVKRNLTHLCPDQAPVKVKDLVEDRERLARRVQELEGGASTSGLPDVSQSFRSPNGVMDGGMPDITTFGLSPDPVQSFVAAQSQESARHPNGFPSSSSDLGYPGSGFNGSPFHLGNEIPSRPHIHVTSTDSAISPFFNQSHPFHGHLAFDNDNFASSSRPRASPSRSIHSAAPPHTGPFPPHSPRDSSGTLVVSATGRSRFIGPSAASQWLRGGEDAARSRAPSISREASPDAQSQSSLLIHGGSLAGFSSSRTHPTRSVYEDALRLMPHREECEVFADSYFDSFVATGNSTPLLRSEFDLVFDEVTQRQRGWQSGERVSPTYTDLHKLALVHIVLALGRLMSTELKVNDPRAKQSFDASQRCLSDGQFLSSNTITSLQTLSLMARYLGYSDVRGGFELAYQLRGAALRLMCAMGLHRDGHSWRLSPADLNQRRRVFWDIYSCDVYSSKNLDRPNGLALDQFDTQFPDEFFTPEGTYDLRRCELVVIAKEVLDESLKMRAPPYARIIELWNRLKGFEEDIPYVLRCRAAAIAQVSRHQTPEAAMAFAPDAPRKNMGLAFKQHTLILNSCLTVFTLLRPYFVDALYAFPADPLQSEYGDAYLAVVERCIMLISMLSHLHSLFPLSSTRQWHFWTHVFSAAVCLSTIPIVSPQTALTGLAMSYLDTAIALSREVQDVLPQRSLQENLGWLIRLRERAWKRMNEVHLNDMDASNPLELTIPERPIEPDVAEHLSLVGWRTKLVELGRTSPPRTSLPSTGPKMTQGQGFGGVADEKGQFSVGVDSFEGLVDFDELRNGVTRPLAGMNEQAIDVLKAFPPELFQELLGSNADVTTAV